MSRMLTQKGVDREKTVTRGGGPGLLLGTMRSFRYERKRRKVQSPSTEHIVPILQELLPERVHVKLTTAYACVPCFRSADKLFKLREEVRKKEKELQQQVNHRKDGLMRYAV